MTTSNMGDDKALRVRAQVLEVHASQVLVQAQPQSGCQACAEGRGCGGGVLGKLVQSRRQPIALNPSGLKLQRGDAVWLVADSRMLQSLALMTWGLPVVALLGVAMALDYFSGVAAGLSVVLFGLLGLQAPRVAAKRLSRRAMHLETIQNDDVVLCSRA